MVVWVVSALVASVTIAWLSFWFFIPRDSYRPARAGTRAAKAGTSRVQVLVLGDIGRSPRMQNHALSLIKCGCSVDLIGYLESELHPRLAGHKRLTVFPIDHPPRFLQTGNRLLFMLFGPLKVLHQLWSLWMILARRTKPARWLLVQNPPSIPTLFVGSMVCRLRNTSFAIDWHNFGYSILALKLGPHHPMVRVSYTYEKKQSRLAHLNFTVSEAMSRQLREEFGIKAPLRRLYDRPNEDFKPLSRDERRAFLSSKELAEQLPGLPDDRDTKFVVSSTSWTPDEDFSILLDALVGYASEASSPDSTLPDLMVIITGKGPQKQSYLQTIKKLQAKGKLAKVTIKTAWLSTEAYARLLASADLGISLHQSSSGVDLPMKVVDMFGAGLPVLGWGKFESWPELVQENVNGRSFDSVATLQATLIELLSDNDRQLTKLREGVLQERSHDWDAEWRDSAGQAMGLLEPS